MSALLSNPTPGLSAGNNAGSMSRDSKSWMAFTYSRRFSRIAAHRLNRLEYVNAIHDLLSLDIDPALLPADNPGVGFDNNADILSVTPGLMNRYMSAASKVSRLAIGDP